MNLSWCGTCGWFRSPSSVHSLGLGGHGELYTGPWKSKILMVLSASPVHFLSKIGFTTPLIVAANKSYWWLDESAKMWGGTLGPDQRKMRVWRKNAHVDMSGRFIRASRRAAGAARGSSSPNKLFDRLHQLEITTKCCILVLIKVLFRR